MGASKARKKLPVGTVGGTVMWLVALLFGVAAGAHAQTQLTPSQLRDKYPKMAPIEDYLMNRDAEIALARTAAPEAISKDASVLVLTRHGWETAVKGTNGFVCMVERSWGESIDYPEFWNPKIRGVDCLNPAAARSILPIEYKLTEMTLAGDSEKQLIVGIQAAYAKKELPPVEPGAMGFMMSKETYVTDSGSHNLSHLMFFVAARKTDSEWGGWLPHVPLGSSSFWFPDPGHENPLDRELPPIRVLYIAVPRWSDGTSVLAK
ncbi:MAG TPA: hypothetical protein VJN21_02800 [Candidatus Acidoferrales bacterium]|nr:hypothetical protein [Candidatus Acidoferrales bacterium]